VVLGIGAWGSGLANGSGESARALAQEKLSKIDFPPVLELGFAVLVLGIGAWGLRFRSGFGISSRALAEKELCIYGRLKFTVRRNQFNKDSPFQN
jgi:hypothetical protein